MIQRMFLTLGVVILAACASVPGVNSQAVPGTAAITQAARPAGGASGLTIATADPAAPSLKPTRKATPLPTRLSPTRSPADGTFTVSTAAPTSTPPDEARISPIFGEHQSLPLSCEARAAADWANFFSVPIQEIEFQNRLPLSDDPDLGFVGDPNDVWGNIPPRAYGVHAGPVAALLRQYGLPAEARRYMTLDELKNEIAHGRPVIVWVVGHIVAGTPQVYTSQAGRQVTVAAQEHALIVTGYSREVMYVQDGAYQYARATQHFINSWGALGNMAVIYRAP